MKEDNIYKDFIEKFGEDIQLNFAIEEMSELTKAICKYKRKSENCTNEEKQKLLKDVFEEIADVKICINVLIYMFNCSDAVKKFEDFKLDRGQERLKKNYYNLQVEEKNE